MGLLAASATVELPSAVGLALAGYGRVRIGKHSIRGLEANLLLLAGTNEKVLILSIDVLFVGATLTDALRSRLPTWRVLPFATHTHSAPQVDADKPMLGAFEPSWCLEVVNRVVAKVNELEGQLVEVAKVSKGEARVLGGIYRRLPTKGITLTRKGPRFNLTLMAPNFAVDIPGVARVARLVSAVGDVAIVVSWACHPTTTIDPEGVSSDYVGHVRDRIRAAMGLPSVPILFLQGFAGDIRAIGGAHPNETARQTRFWPFASSELIGWEDAVAEGILKVLDAATVISNSDALELNTLGLPLNSFLSGPARSIELAWLTVTPDWQLFALSAEPSFAHEHEAGILETGAWGIGYLGDVFGYLPTDAQVNEGGYEVYDYMPLFGIKGQYVGSINRALCKAVAKLKRPSL